jgi:hypothetical protein
MQAALGWLARRGATARARVRSESPLQQASSDGPAHVHKDAGRVRREVYGRAGKSTTDRGPWDAMRLAKQSRRVSQQQQRIPRRDPCPAPLLPGTVEKELGSRMEAQWRIQHQSPLVRPDAEQEMVHRRKDQERWPGRAKRWRHWESNPG